MTSAIIGAVTAVILVFLIIAWLLYRRTTDLYRFRRAQGQQLIEYIRWIFCRKGYTLSAVKYVSDKQAEAIIVKNSVATMVQIRQRRSKVPRTMIKFLYNTALKADCDWAVLICPAGFTKDAYKLAREYGITLYDGRWLSNVLKGCRLKFTA